MTKIQSDKRRERRDDDREYTYEEYVRKFAPDLPEEPVDEPEEDTFSARLTKDLIDILRHGRIMSAKPE